MDEGRGSGRARDCQCASMTLWLSNGCHCGYAIHATQCDLPAHPCHSGYIANITPKHDVTSVSHAPRLAARLTAPLMLGCTCSRHVPEQPGMPRLMAAQFSILLMRVLLP